MNLMGEWEKEVWFDGRGVPLEQQGIWGLINTSSLDKVVVTVSQKRDGHFPQKTQLITEIQGELDLEGMAEGEIVLATQPELLAKAKQKGCKTCLYSEIHDRASLERIRREANIYDYVVVDFNLPTNIPLELLLASLQGKKVLLLRRVTTFAEMEVAFGVLEKGSDGVLFVSSEIGEILKVRKYLSQTAESQVTLRELAVTEVRHVGMGMRACLDTTGLMSQDEGMLVGSTSAGGIFVCSETHYLPYMNLRPFRVNAGAVHSYVWMPHNTAEYITDLRAGSKVLCVNTRGRARVLTLGRIKIEARPLLLVKGVAAGKELNVVVQDDWHIRLMGTDGKPQNATLVKPGDKLLAYVCQPGRHVGIKVEEAIIEQ